MAKKNKVSPEAKDLRKNETGSSDETSAETSEVKELTPAAHVEQIELLYRSIKKQHSGNRELEMAVDSLLKTLEDFESCAKNVDHVLADIDAKKAKAAKIKGED